MTSLYEELADKIERNAAASRRGVSTFDLTLLLFNSREDLRDLWVAANADIAQAARDGREPPADLVAAVEKLRPVFGERSAT